MDSNYCVFFKDQNGSLNQCTTTGLGAATTIPGQIPMYPGIPSYPPLPSPRPSSALSTSSTSAGNFLAAANLAQGEVILMQETRNQFGESTTSAVRGSVESVRNFFNPAIGGPIGGGNGFMPQIALHPQRPQIASYAQQPAAAYAQQPAAAYAQQPAAAYAQQQNDSSRVQILSASGSDTESSVSKQSSKSYRVSQEELDAMIAARVEETLKQRIDAMCVSKPGGSSVVGQNKVPQSSGQGSASSAGVKTPSVAGETLLLSDVKSQKEASVVGGKKMERSMAQASHVGKRKADEKKDEGGEEEDDIFPDDSASNVGGRFGRSVTDAPLFTHWLEIQNGGNKTKSKKHRK